MRKNVELCVDLVTRLQKDAIMESGKDYIGILKRIKPSEDTDFDDSNFSFTEIASQKPVVRNPRVFDGKYLTVTRRADGTYRLNFKPIEIGKGFRVYDYAIGVFNEILKALKGLVEE